MNAYHDPRYSHLVQENQRLQQMIHSYIQHIQYLDRITQRLSAENRVLREFMDKWGPPVKIENLHISNDINLDHLRVNTVQSGAAFNIGEKIANTTNSDMDMELGPNSMNNGDHIKMDHTDEPTEPDGSNAADIPVEPDDPHEPMP